MKEEVKLNGSACLLFLDEHAPLRIREDAIAIAVLTRRDVVTVPLLVYRADRHDRPGGHRRVIAARKHDRHHQRTKHRGRGNRRPGNGRKHRAGDDGYNRQAAGHLLDQAFDAVDRIGREQAFSGATLWTSLLLASSLFAVCSRGNPPTKR